MSQIKITDLTFSYDGGEDIFKNVSFSIDTDWRLGFIGRNGRGKTTFLRLLMGRYPYSGKISASVNFQYFPFPIPDHDMTAAELAEAIAPSCELWRLNRELSLLEVSEDVLYRPVSSLSNGELVKVQLAILFMGEDGFLLIDEPTNHLDLKGRRLVSSYLGRKNGFILVSHDRDFLDNSVDHILSINRAGIEVMQGNFTSWETEKLRRDSAELRQNEKLQGEIKRLKTAARQAADWSDNVEKTKYATKNSGLRPDRGFVGHKSAKMMQRSKSIENRRLAAAQEKEGLLKNLESRDELLLRPLTYRGKRLVVAEGLAISYGEIPACADVSFAIEPGDRVALTGKNGSGKSSILKLLNGESIPHTGSLTIGSGLVISYVPQDAGFLSGELAAFAEAKGVELSLLSTVLRKLDFSRSHLEHELNDLSEGQKKKVLLAASLCTPAHLYVWDEPLNYVDVISRMQLEDLINRFSPTLLFVEHDSRFCQNIATKTIEL